MTDMPFLYCRDLYKRTEWSVELDDARITLGGSSTATVPLPDRSLEACEVVIRQGADGAVLEDHAASGRVTWNDSPLAGGEEATRPLKSGDRIRLGRLEVVFYPKAPDEPPIEAVRPEFLEPGPDPRFGPRQLAALGIATWLLGLGVGLVLGILGVGR